MMDRLLAAQIRREVSHLLDERLLSVEERWVSGEILAQHISCMNRNWQKRHGHELPRVKVAHSNRWSYPLYRIKKMIEGGQLLTDEKA